MLAIIIPYFKLTFFEATLASLAAQTCQDFKVYIGDDASPEDPSNLIEKYKGQFDFSYHRFEDNLGGTSLTKQWERCIALSGNEEWLMILGDDDYLGENVVESWCKNFNKFSNNSYVIRFATKIKDESLGGISAIFEHPVWELAPQSYWRKYRNLSRSSLSEYVFSRFMYEEHRFKEYPLAWNSDDTAWIDFSGEKPIFTINESIVYIRMSTLNISGKSDNLKLKNESQLLFFKYILFKKTRLFNTEQLNNFALKYEFEILKERNLSIREWISLLNVTIMYLGSQNTIKLVKRFLKSFYY